MILSGSSSLRVRVEACRCWLTGGRKSYAQESVATHTSWISLGQYTRRLHQTAERTSATPQRLAARMFCNSETERERIPNRTTTIILSPGRMFMPSFILACRHHDCCRTTIYDLFLLIPEPLITSLRHPHPKVDETSQASTTATNDSLMICGQGHRATADYEALSCRWLYPSADGHIPKMEPRVVVRKRGSSSNNNTNPHPTKNQVIRPTPLRHPTPDLHSLLRSFPRNISRIEQSAEELSAGGSDIGEEIRKMNEEQKVRSRQNSVQSAARHELDGDESGDVDDDTLSREGSGKRLQTTERRGASLSGHSILDVNGAARGGGYSPGAFVASPVESSRSGSWSHASMPRKSSTAGSSRLAQMVEPLQEGRPLDSPLAPSNASYTPSRQTSQASNTSQTSYARQYDRIADEIEASLQDVPPSPPKHAVSLPMDTNDPDHIEHATHLARPRSADTFQEAQFAFEDFDGVHYAPGDEFVELDENGNEVRRVSARGSSGKLSVDAASILLAPRQPPRQVLQRMSYGAPPPAENMVYYPAPVPRMLNLPKRLSQLPAANVQSNRRTQLLGQLSPGARQSAPWLSQANAGDAERSGRSDQERNDESQLGQRGMLNERMSIANFNNLPPQLRASVFFEHQTVVQDVEVKHGSAVATLDNILAASATAPVSAFTDHPYAGDVRKSVYMAEHAVARQRSASFGTDGVDNAGSKRQSSMGRLLRRASGGNELETAIHNNGSRNSILADFNDGSKKMQKRKSRMSMGHGLDRQSQPITTSHELAEEADMSPGLISDAQNATSGAAHEEEIAQMRANGSSGPGRRILTDNERIAEDFREAAAGDEIDEGEPVFAAPTTLLAELQVRKTQQKSRNRTAATAFPNGMHSTLLQMDAVDEITRRKRQKNKVALAWEDPNAEEPADEDDNVPLGMLYPGKDGLANRKMGDDHDWDRPLGLMAKRELEDNEPLSSRKNRLQGLPPSHGRRSMMFPSTSELHLAGQPDAPPEDIEEDEHADESLGQRMRRVKTKDALDLAISDVAPKPGSRPISTFTDDVLSQFGGLDVKEVEGAGGGLNDTGNISGQAPPEAEDETLGQRRARLQREREAAGTSAQASARPALKSSNSLASLLTTNPAGLRNMSRSRDHTPAEGTLLHANAQAQSRHKQALLNTNIRSSSYGVLHLPIEPPSQPGYPMSSPGLHGQYMRSHGSLASGLRAPTQQPFASPAVYGMNGTNGYFASPTMGMGIGSNSFAYPGSNAMMGMGMPAPMAAGFMMPQQQQQQQQFYPQTMRAGTYGAAAMGMAPAPGFGHPEDISLDPRQRAKIDQWRMSVAP
nr:hypothetical protein CFP56_37095 [Quercus suber]